MCMCVCEALGNVTGVYAPTLQLQNMLRPQVRVKGYTYCSPGAGELITGPTLLGDVMAAGNLICASPPYLITTTEELISVHVQCE